MAVIKVFDSVGVKTLVLAGGLADEIPYDENEAAEEDPTVEDE